MNSSDRDFKGVWMPKEIWLNSELTILEKVIFTEIDSLDNENHCIASNEYFANFCDCSESKISKAIKKLKDLQMTFHLPYFMQLIFADAMDYRFQQTITLN